MDSEMAASAGLSAHPTITLHSSGDITQLIGTGEYQQPVIAASAILRKASPVWNAMYTGSWSESTNSEIQFPDDDVNTMLIVLNIAHLNFKGIPRARGLSLETLVQLCVICDEYDTLPIARPFLDLYNWARDDYTDWENEIEDHFYYNEWLFVSQTLGYKESFLAVAKDLILTMSIDDQKPNNRAMAPIYVKTQYGDTFGDIIHPGVFG
ncbi:hypothetical protein BS50DRAFT_156350 [Corynespora cassiicola Philippines]|uniref:BTB domain-containing protein n=1 Tax=Corynespora cassiicola Philippines TaxID=1448308 RepID=A0A2T2N7K2_CORCC|nr:hypothetical protein BS50DRAFT_156350 [Corynespora cassiicola Philippines]